MPSIGVFNGVSILQVPSLPAARQIKLAMNNVVAVSKNVYTGANTQVQAWPGGDFWTASISLPQMTIACCRAWEAFLAECRGMLNVFYLSDSSYSGPQGQVSGNPVVRGVNAAMAFTLNTKGWTANQFGLLLPGDYLQLDYHLHRVTERVNSDANGDAAISIWPSIRAATTDGQALVLNQPQGVFRLATNQQSVTIDETRMAGISLDVVEAR